MRGQRLVRRPAHASITGRRGALHGSVAGEVSVRATPGGSVCLEIVDPKGWTASLYFDSAEAVRVAILARKAAREVQAQRRSL